MDELSSAPTIVIEDNATPMAMLADGNWSVVNLGLVVLVAMLCIALIVMFLREGTNDDVYEEYRNDLKSREAREGEMRHTLVMSRLLHITSILPLIVRVIAFAVTQDLRGTRVVYDEWTPLISFIAVFQFYIAFLVHSKRNELGSTQTS